MVASSAPSSHLSQNKRSTNGRSAARLAATQALYQADATSASIQEISQGFLSGQLGGVAIVTDQDSDKESEISLANMDTDLFAALMHGVQNSGEHIDNVIMANVSNEWPWERLEMTLRALLRAGTAEILTQSGTPHKVIIAEFVDVAHAFYAGPEPRMVNAVLDRVAMDLGRK